MNGIGLKATALTSCDTVLLQSGAGSLLSYIHPDRKREPSPHLNRAASTAFAFVG